MLTSKLLTNIKRRCTIPANQRLLDDTDMLDICDTVIMEKIVPEIISLRQDFFVLSSDIALSDGVDKYPIPYRSIGRTLRDLKLKYADGSKSDLSLVAIEDEHFFGRSASIPTSFYFKGDQIVLCPPPSSGLVLEIWWDMPPSALVLPSEAATVANVTGDTVTVDIVPASITIGSEVDFIDHNPGFCTYGFDLTVSNIVGTAISFNVGALTGMTIKAGDYIAFNQTSPVVQLPREVTPFLETLATRRVLQAIGDFEGLKMLGEDNDDDLKQIRRLLEPRIRGESTKIVNRNGLLRGAGFRTRRGVVF